MKKGNMYEGVVTWNPLAGECPQKCIYCSTNKFFYPAQKAKYSGELRIDEKQLNRKFKPGSTVFVVGQNDLFADKVPFDFIETILKHCTQKDVTYFFQSKNTHKLYHFIDYLPQNSIVCTTLESNRQYLAYNECVPSPIIRAYPLSLIYDFQKQITIEPIMKFDLNKFVDLIKMCEHNQINIGANTYKKVQLPEPTKEEVLALISELEKFTKVVQKSNLGRLLK